MTADRVAGGVTDDILLFIQPEQRPDAAGDEGQQNKMQGTGVQPLAEGGNIGRIVFVLDV
ncbi:hypothetical protein M2772_000685 [Salmonella enterica subsp. enterica serovar Bovismorbificans]|nr:hypothetical protein [Salmonella enterica]EJD8897465.1 hypothetical protein [Salmonella enterica subsp. enterica serovar Bovismorbificans]